MSTTISTPLPDGSAPTVVLTPTGAPAAASPGITSLEEWESAGVHTVTLYSHRKVKVRLPDLQLLVKKDMVPERLRGLVLKQLMGEIPLSGNVEQSAAQEDAERYDTIKKLIDLTDWLILEMVVEPKLTPEALVRIPSEDKELLLAIAQRERDTDALGVRLGVEPLSQWDRFRDHHGCDKDCVACKALQDEFSTVHAG